MAACSLENRSTTSGYRARYIRLLCPVTKAAISLPFFAVHADGSPQVDLVFLPRSSGNNGWQKITKEDVSGKNKRGKLERGSRSAAHLQDWRKPRENSFLLLCFFPPKGHTSVLGKCFYLPCSSQGRKKNKTYGSICLQKLRCFPIKGLLLTQNWESNSHCE